MIYFHPLPTNTIPIRRPLILLLYLMQSFMANHKFWFITNYLMHPNIWYVIMLTLSGCMKQNNRQLPDSKLLSLFSTWQQWHQTASVQLTAVAPALMNNLRLASLLCLAGTSGDTCPVWGGTGALCPRHTWQWRDKSVTCPSVIRSPVWSLGSRQPVTHRLCREYQDSGIGTLNSDTRISKWQQKNHLNTLSCSC